MMKAQAIGWVTLRPIKHENRRLSFSPAEHSALGTGASAEFSHQSWVTPQPYGLFGSTDSKACLTQCYTEGLVQERTESWGRHGEQARLGLARPRSVLHLFPGLYNCPEKFCLFVVFVCGDCVLHGEDG